MPKWWGKEREERNRRTRKQEAGHAKATGGKQQAGSGSSYRAPGDVLQAEFLDELKWTDKGSRALDLREWESHRTKALLMGRQPRMFVDFTGSKRRRTRLMITEVPFA